MNEANQSNQPPDPAHGNESKTPFYYSDIFIILTLFCCSPVGVVLMWAGQKWSQGARIAITAVVGLLFLIGLVTSPAERTQTGKTASGQDRAGSASSDDPAPATKAEPAQPKLKYVSESCREVSEKFGTGSKLSELQKDELWKKYAGKGFKWNLEVSEVHPAGMFGGYTVQYKCAPQSDSLMFDIQLVYDKQEKDHVMQLMKGENYEVEGVLKRSGSIMGLSGEAIVR